jgi:hypothetical protein
LRAEGKAGREVLGHRDGYATDCPGPYLYRWVKQGARRPERMSTMPTAEEIAAAVVDRGYNARGHQVKDALQVAHDGIPRIEAELQAQSAKLDAIVAALTTELEKP